MIHGAWVGIVLFGLFVLCMLGVVVWRRNRGGYIGVPMHWDEAEQAWIGTLDTIFHEGEEETK